MSLQRIRPTRLIAGTVCLLLAAGVHSASPAQEQGQDVITGKVNFQGKPLTSGSVTFFPEKGKGRGAPINRDGTYKVVGLPPGQYTVAIDNAVAPTPKDKVQRPKGLEKQGKVAAPPPEWVLPEGVAARYRDRNRSPLRVNTVKGKQNFDFELR
jgi:hypothetical protein